MAIFRWGANHDPLGGLRQLQHELERMVWPWVGQSRRIGGGAYPPVNLYESDDDVLVQCELPGVEPEDLDVSITGETLTIQGVKRDRPGEQEVRYVRRERGSGDFTRTVVLPDPVDPDRIDARLDNGLLTITLPKSAAAKPRQVQIRSGAQEG